MGKAIRQTIEIYVNNQLGKQIFLDKPLGKNEKNDLLQEYNCIFLVSPGQGQHHKFPKI